MPKMRLATQMRSRGLTIVGALLITLLTILAFAGGRLFGRVEESAATVVSPEMASVSTDVAEAQVTPAPPTELPAAPTATVVQTPQPLPASFGRAPVICLDPGHGGPDRGFSRYADDGSPLLEEAPLVLDEAWQVKALLEQHSYVVVMTRDTDTAVNIDGKDINSDGRTAAHDPPGSDRNKTIDELQSRINVCNDAHADLLVSMHLNGYSTGTPHGYETWFTRERPFGDRNAVIATLIYAHLKEQFADIGYKLPPDEERGVLPDTTADVQKEHQVFDHFIVTGPEVPGAVKPSEMPGVIAEALFLSNERDAGVLSSPEGESAIAHAYANAVVEYFDRFPPAAH
jgi:N-acetylmuramoyl-L-alanine amidase